MYEYIGVIFWLVLITYIIYEKRVNKCRVSKIEENYYFPFRENCHYLVKSNHRSRALYGKEYCDFEKGEILKYRGYRTDRDLFFIAFLFTDAEKKERTLWYEDDLENFCEIYFVAQLPLLPDTMSEEVKKHVLNLYALNPRKRFDALQTLGTLAETIGEDWKPFARKMKDDNGLVLVDDKYLRISDSVGPILKSCYKAKSRRKK